MSIDKPKQYRKRYAATAYLSDGELFLLNDTARTLGISASKVIRRGILELSKQTLEEQISKLQAADSQGEN
jgi:hypothetical protein